MWKYKPETRQRVSQDVGLQLRNMSSRLSHASLQKSGRSPMKTNNSLISHDFLEGDSPLVRMSPSSCCSLKSIFGRIQPGCTICRTERDGSLCVSEEIVGRCHRRSKGFKRQVISKRFELRSLGIYIIYKYHLRMTTCFASKSENEAP